MTDLLKHTAGIAQQYLENLPQREVFPTQNALDALAQFDEPLPNEPTDPQGVINMLAEVGGPATVATAGQRYFGFVTGAALPVTVAANWLAAAWDQNAAVRVMSPVGAKLEDVSLEWLKDLFGLPASTGGGFVTGATAANFTAMVAARHALLARAGWNVEADGLFGAPELRVVTTDEVHTSMLKALSMVGFGFKRIERVPTDSQGRMIAEELPELDERTIVCLQVGNVNTGSSDPVRATCEKAHDAGAWVHVDGAFGLWAAASPEQQHLVDGLGLADSWATDGHKWLNVPYDSGLVFVRDPLHLQAAMTLKEAVYIIQGEEREPYSFTPEMSRRARGIEIWAALKALGRQGVADLVSRHCRQAQRFADGLREAGIEVLNDVELNQVLVKFGNADTTAQVIKVMQEERVMWAGNTTWQGHAAMRISVSGWGTTDEDIDRSLQSLLSAVDSVSEVQVV